MAKSLGLRIIIQVARSSNRKFSTGKAMLSCLFGQRVTSYRRKCRSDYALLQISSGNQSLKPSTSCKTNLSTKKCKSLHLTDAILWAFSCQTQTEFAPFSCFSFASSRRQVLDAHRRASAKTSNIFWRSSPRQGNERNFLKESLKTLLFLSFLFVSFGMLCFNGFWEGVGYDIFLW